MKKKLLLSCLLVLPFLGGCSVNLFNKSDQKGLVALSDPMGHNEKTKKEK